MPKTGWQRLVAGTSWFRSPGRYPIPAYSEFMPPPRLLAKAGEHRKDYENFLAGLTIERQR